MSFQQLLKWSVCAELKGRPRCLPRAARMAFRSGGGAAMASFAGAAKVVGWKSDRKYLESD